MKSVVDTDLIPGNIVIDNKNQILIAIYDETLK